MFKIKGEKPKMFHQMGLDARILEAIAFLHWKKPTIIQAKAVPYFLAGKDIVATSRTGSGKTGAYLIPLIQAMIENRVSVKQQTTTALILAPTKELSNQITGVLTVLTRFCRRGVRFVDISAVVPYEAQKPLLTNNPDIVIGTPGRILGHMNENNLQLKDTLQYFIMDEADLMLGNYQEGEVQDILKKLPRIFQSFLTSATLGDNLKKLNRFALNKPKILKFDTPLPTAEQLAQYVLKIDDNDKCVILLCLFLLNLISGKTIIFVNRIFLGYRLSLFLEQYCIKSCVLNSQMPATSRCNIVRQFNEGLYKIIIASDEHESKTKIDKESGVARGIDFMFVENIINYDFPYTLDDYIHRVGRTARGTFGGTALSLVNQKEMKRLQKVQTQLKKMMPGCDDILKDFSFDMQQLDGFRYRALDAWNQCDGFAIDTLRRQEITKELLASTKLQRFFQNSQRDENVIRHDVSTTIKYMNKTLNNIPDYMCPANLKNRSNTTGLKSYAGPGPVRKRERQKKLNDDPLHQLENMKWTMKPDHYSFKRRRQRKVY